MSPPQSSEPCGAKTTGVGPATAAEARTVGSGGRIGRTLRGLRGPSGRAAWSLLDQSISSLTNVVLGIIVARSVSQQGFGAFSTVYLAYTFLVLLSRAATSEVLVVRFSAVDSSRHREGAETAVGAALLIGLGGVPMLGLVAGLSEGELASGFLVLTFLLPGLLVQDAWRFVFFSGRRPAAAALNDVVWGVSLLGVLGVLTYYGKVSVVSALLAWGAGAYVAAVFGAVQSKLLPRPSLVRSWWSGHRDLIPRFVAEYIFMRGSNHVAFVAIAAITTLASFGALRAAYLLLGPLKVFLASAIIVAVPEGVRLYHRRPAQMMRLGFGVSATCGVISVLVGAVILTLPADLGRSLLGESWTGAQALLLPLIVAAAAFGAEMGPTLALRAMARARESLAAKALMAPVRVACAVVGATVWGIQGAAWGLALGETIGVVVWWKHFIAVTTQVESPLDPKGHGREPASMEAGKLPESMPGDDPA